MALQHSPPHLGSIGDEVPEPELEPDRVYERKMEARIEDDGWNDAGEVVD